MTLMLTVLLLALQGLDVGVHIATDQFELIRAASNFVIVGGAVSILIAPKHARAVGMIVGSIYLLLNIAFLAQNGMTNPATESPRLPLFGFVILSIMLLAFCVKRARKIVD